MRSRLQLLLLITVALILCSSVIASPPKAGAKAELITVKELSERIEKGDTSLFIIDVRHKDYDSSDSRIKGAVRISPDKLSESLASIPQDKEIVTYCSCKHDEGSLDAVHFLKQNGFKQARALRGGWPFWLAAHGPVEKK